MDNAKNEHDPFVSRMPLSSIKKIVELILPFAIPLLAAWWVAQLFYPGFMTYDSLHALRSARGEVTESMWPPMVSYVWRAVDLISDNPSAMHFSQVFLLLSSVSFIILWSTNKIKFSAIFLAIYLSIPVVIGTVAVIWKDVLMAAFLLAGFSIVIWMQQVKNSYQFYFLSFLAAMLFFLGICSRHNAITGALPLLFYWAFVTINFSGPVKSLQRWVMVFFLGIGILGTLFFSKSYLDTHSLPSFKEMPSSTGSFIRGVRALDIAGASVCAGENLFADMAPNLTIDEITQTYDPKHINSSRKLLNQLNFTNVDKVWINVAIHHPFCFLSNKLQLTKYMIGANASHQYLIDSGAIDDNEFGYVLAKSPYRDAAVHYIHTVSDLFFYRPWFIYILTIVAFVYAMRAKLLDVTGLMMLSSGFLYFSGLVAFGNAADARLLFYTTTVFSMFTFITAIKFIKRVK